MWDLFSSQKIAKFSAPFLLMAVFEILAGCSAGTTVGAGTSGTGGTTGTPAATPSMAVALANNSISTGTSTAVNATLKDAAGAAIPNAIVTFSTAPAMGTLSVATALTNGAGVATVTLT